jgi:hypothetical protein
VVCETADIEVQEVGSVLELFVQHRVGMWTVRIVIWDVAMQDKGEDHGSRSIAWGSDWLEVSCHQGVSTFHLMLKDVPIMTTSTDKGDMASVETAMGFVSRSP